MKGKRKMILPTSENSVIVLIDMQEKLVRAMSTPESTTKACRMLMQGADALQCPVIVTEQYPTGLGSTLEEISSVLPAGTPIIEKTSFSCYGTEAFAEAIQKLDRECVILCGVESHVCVLQTAMDAIAAGKIVYIVTDGVSSRKESDRDTGLQYLRHNGVQELSAEALLFMMLRNSKHPAFKTISALVR
jgi:nicotinamidase-related amidase